MRHKMSSVSAALLGVCLSGSWGMLANSAHAQTGSTQNAPDNSGQNKNQSPTADNQSSVTSDRLTTAKIRRSIIADKSLSTYAHNIKIVTAHGAVTLQGPVNTADEKDKVAAYATSVVGADKVANNLTVKQ